MGPSVSNTPGGPTITLNSGNGDSGRAGCDGCNMVFFDINVDWPAGGDVSVSGFGYFFQGQVAHGSTSNHKSTTNWPMQCGTEHVMNVTDGDGDVSKVIAYCSTCL